MRVRIEVTEKDIKNGQPQDDNECPIALALKRVIDDVEVDEVRVDPDEVRFEVGADEIEVQLPGRARRFIERFDEDEDDVKPFKFTLSIPSDLLKKSTTARKRKEKKP